jgi:carbamate kinase
MVQKIVIALGGNAILDKDPSEAAQKEAIKYTSKSLVKLIEDGHKVVITHGNGPQVGNLLLQQIESNSDSNPALSLHTCVGMTQGSIGYWLQNTLANELKKQEIDKTVVSLVTQVVVDSEDPGFKNPTKPIGPFYTEEGARNRTNQNGEVFVEDSGRGWRRVVPSPKPIDIVEKSAIAEMVSRDFVVIAGGGGGIPVVRNADGTYTGIECVIDKDFASAKISEIIEADLFVILTGVSHVAINYNKPGQRNLTKINLNELKRLKEQGHFAPGSMLPKVEAAIKFIEANPSKKAIITSLDNLPNILSDNPGTVIVG